MRKRSEGEKLKAGRPWLVWSGSLGGQCQKRLKERLREKFTESGSDTIDRNYSGILWLTSTRKGEGGREERKTGGAQQQQHRGESLTSTLGFTKTITN